MVEKLTQEHIRDFTEVVENDPSLGPDQINARCDQFIALVQKGALHEENPLYAKMLMATARIKAIYGDFPRSMEILEQILQLAKKTDNTAWINKTMNNMALVKQYSGELFEAIELFEEVRKNTTELSEKIQFTNNLGVAYHRAGKFSKAVEAYLSVLEMLENLDSPNDKADVYNNLGNIYRETGHKDEAKKYYDSALALYEKLADNERLALIYNNMCVFHLESLNADQAERFGEIAFEYYQKYQPPRLISTALNNLANAKYLAEKLDEAKQLYYQAVDSSIEHNDINMQINCMNNLALVLYKLGEIDLAIEYASKALVKSEQINFLSGAKTASALLKDAWKKKKKYQKAFEAQEKIIEINDNIALSSTRLDIALAESEYLQKRLEKQIEIYREQYDALEASNKIISEKTLELETNNNLLSTTNALMNRIISIIAHDVRGPVSTISQTLDLFEGDLLSLEDRAEFIVELQKSAKFTTQLIADLLDLAQKYKAGVDEKAETFELNEQIHRNIALADTTARPKGIIINFNTDTDPLMVSMNKSRLNLILRNLIANAIKFSHPDSNILIELQKTKDLLNISIVDYGRGMTPEQVDSVLSGASFTELGTLSEKGFGMGLVFALESILYTNGKLEIQSSPGKGSIFNIIYKLADLQVLSQ